MRKCDVGGQAIIEGVMMRGAKGIATAVRTPNGEIEVKVEKTKPITKKYKFLNILITASIKFKAIEEIPIFLNNDAIPVGIPKNNPVATKSEIIILKVTNKSFAALSPNFSFNQMSNFDSSSSSLRL